MKAMPGGDCTIRADNCLIVRIEKVLSVATAQVRSQQTTPNRQPSQESVTCEFHSLAPNNTDRLQQWNAIAHDQAILILVTSNIAAGHAVAPAETDVLQRAALNYIVQGDITLPLTGVLAAGRLDVVAA